MLRTGRATVVTLQRGEPEYNLSRAMSRASERLLYIARGYSHPHLSCRSRGKLQSAARYRCRPRNPKRIARRVPGSLSAGA